MIICLSPRRHSILPHTNTHLWGLIHGDVTTWVCAGMKDPLSQDEERHWSAPVTIQFSCLWLVNQCSLRNMIVAIQTALSETSCHLRWEEGEGETPPLAFSFGFSSHPLIKTSGRKWKNGHWALSASQTTTLCQRRTWLLEAEGEVSPKWDLRWNHQKAG